MPNYDKKTLKSQRPPYIYIYGQIFKVSKMKKWKI